MTLNTIIGDMENEYSDLTNAYDDGKEKQYFQFWGNRLVPRGAPNHRSDTK